jgi:hypothetical protein
MEKLLMKTMEDLVKELKEKDKHADSGAWQAVQGHEERLCHEAHELQMLASVLNFDSFADEWDAFIDLCVRLEMKAKEKGVPLFDFRLEGWGESRQVALRIGEELQKAHPEHGICVRNGQWRLQHATDMEAIGEKHTQREREDGDFDLEDFIAEQTHMYTFADSAILSVIDDEMPDLVAPGGNCNPSWLLYTILVGHRRTPLTAKEVNYLMSLSMDGTAKAQMPAIRDKRDAHLGTRALNEAFSRALMTW